MIFVYNGLRIHYETIGNGRPIILLHGWGNDLDTMRSIASLVKQLGYQSISLDMPGFGLSDYPKSSWGVREYTDLVKSFIEERGINTVTVVAHSFGGRVAISLAAKYSTIVDKLVLIDSAGLKPSRSISYYVSAYFSKSLRMGAKIFPHQIRACIDENILAKMGSADYRKAGKLRDTFIKIVNEDLREFLPLIKAPTLLIWGELDQETPVTDGKVINGLIQNSRLCIIRRAGHHSFLDNTQTFSAILTPFLQGENQPFLQHGNVSWW